MAEERVNLSAVVVKMQNEILNNTEEEYIILGSTGYFTGFNTAMANSIVQVLTFPITGDTPTDYADIASILLLDQQAAAAESTASALGEATAYEYAFVLLGDSLNTLYNGPSKTIKAQEVASVPSPAAPSQDAPIHVALSQDARLQVAPTSETMPVVPIDRHILR